MPRLTVLIGPAGSGKTHRVLSEAARLALTAGLPSPAHPPLLVIVPEQQAVTIERALLVRLQELSGGEVAASARLSVMSLTRLAHVLAERAGERLSPLDDLGRQLLVWRLLDDVSDPAERQARATVLADQLAELALYGTSAGDLRRRARELMESPVGDGDPRSAELAPEAARKLTELAQLLDAYSSECAARGLDHSPVVAGIARLLSEDNWPLLAATRVWVDGFAGFTHAGRGKRADGAADALRATDGHPADRSDAAGGTGGRGRARLVSAVAGHVSPLARAGCFGRCPGYGGAAAGLS